MLFFSIVMVLASVRMIRNKQPDDQHHDSQLHVGMIVLQGLAIGILTGIVGAGGGFLIIPALVLLVGLPMKKAIGTSLIIIAINSLIGFAGDLSLTPEINLSLMVTLTVLAIAGVFLGTYLSGFIKGKNLKSGFGWFAFAMALFIIIKEIQKF
mgnify:FL=1